MSKVRLPQPEKGALGNYTTSASDRSRHIALNKSVRENGYKSTVLDLNLRATLNKNQAPGATKVMREDMDYLRGKYRSGKSRSGKSAKSKTMSNKSRKSRSGKSAKTMSNKGSKSRMSKK